MTDSSVPSTDADAGRASVPAEHTGADGADATGDERASPDGRPCPRCDAGMVRRHCKYVCPRHGVVYDCSDTFW